MSLECTTLLKCVDQLHSAIRLDISQFATYLDLNTDEIYRNVLDPSACADQTTRLAHEVMRKVEVDLSSYHKMVNHLRQDKKYSNFVDELDAEYFGIRKLTISADTVDFDELLKQLSVVKEKWYSIGTGLNLPNKVLDQFVNLTDPLLEVIVHWLKGRRDTPPSWDVIVITLRDPSINETELADKIHRLYCSHTQEEKRENIACSDVTSELMKVPLASNFCVPHSELGRVRLKNNYQFSNTQEEYEKYKLKRKTKEIKKSFAHFFAQLQLHMLSLQKDGALDVSVVKSHIVMSDRKLLAPMSQCKSLQDIFETLSLSEHLTFVDYELIKLLVGYGGKKMTNDFIVYKRKLQAFFEKRLIELSSGEGNYFAVVIDESITDDITDMSQLQNRVNFILGHKDLRLITWENLVMTGASSRIVESELSKKFNAASNIAYEHAQLEDQHKDIPVANLQKGQHQEEISDLLPLQGSRIMEKMADEVSNDDSNFLSHTVDSSSKETELQQNKLESRKCSIYQLVAFLLVLLTSILLGCSTTWLPLPTTMNTADTLTKSDPPAVSKLECQSISRNDRHAISLQRLTFLRYVHDEEEKELRIIEDIATSWKKLGVLFGYDVDKIAHNHVMGDGYLEDCCKEVLKKWLQRGGTQNYPISWNGFIRALNDVELTRITLDIEDALMCAIVQ